MKLALCFSGQPRFVQECSKGIIQNVIQNYDVDVFAHLWMDEDLQNKPYKYGGNGDWENQRIQSNAIDQFNSLYNPVDCLVEPSKTFGDTELDQDFHLSLKKYWDGGEKEPDYQRRQINNSLSYFYSLSEVNRIRKLYEYENKIKYDYVIRCRTDSQIIVLSNMKTMGSRQFIALLRCNLHHSLMTGLTLVDLKQWKDLWEFFLY